MLIQYVVHHAPPSSYPTGLPNTDDSKCLTTDLWIEPQYGEIAETPPGLSYLHGMTHTGIADRMYEVDCELITTMSSFLYLHYSCGQGRSQLPPVTWEEEGRREVVRDDRVCGDSRVSKIPFEISSFLTQSRVLGFTLTAFSEGEVVHIDCPAIFGRGAC